MKKKYFNFPFYLKFKDLSAKMINKRNLGKDYESPS